MYYRSVTSVHCYTYAPGRRYTFTHQVAVLLCMTLRQGRRLEFET